MKRADDFLETTKEVLGKRVAYLCSRASCRRPTAGPHTSENKATLVGVAAHICAASPGGPRFDPSMSPEQRRSPENGLWLCAYCATEIDKDPERFPTTLLRQWKADAEVEARMLLENPSLSASRNTPAGIRAATRLSTKRPTAGHRALAPLGFEKRQPPAAGKRST